MASTTGRPPSLWEAYKWQIGVAVALIDYRAAPGAVRELAAREGEPFPAAIVTFEVPP